jgi:hypothetical protein
VGYLGAWYVHAGARLGCESDSVVVVLWQTCALSHQRQGGVCLGMHDVGACSPAFVLTLTLDSPGHLAAIAMTTTERLTDS